MHQIIPAGPESIRLIRELAERTWKVSYRDMISGEQIEYMLDLMYSPESLMRQFSEGARFFIYCRDGIPGGFAGCGPKKNESGTWRLEKIYVLPELQKSGAGVLLLQEVEKTALLSGAERIELNVNRNNPSLAFHQRMGFHIIREEDIDIGGGFFMNDYIMVKPLSPSQNSK